MLTFEIMFPLFIVLFSAGFISLLFGKFNQDESDDDKWFSLSVIGGGVMVLAIILIGIGLFDIAEQNKLDREFKEMQQEKYDTIWNQMSCESKRQFLLYNEEFKSKYFDDYILRCHV